MPQFEIAAPFTPAGDQPKAIEALDAGVRANLREQTLMGVTGSGKTFSIAHVIQRQQRPTLVLSPNKTLAAQLWSEFREFFPNNAVEYFVSYYDYYQPEAYIPRTDTYIEKDSSRNEEIDRLRNSATRALLTRRDVIVVASISCIYGIGSPENYLGESLSLKKGESIRRDIVLRKLADLQYSRNDQDFGRSRFRVRGDVVDVQPAYEEVATRIEFWGDDVESIKEFDPLTGEILAIRDSFQVFPASHYVTPREQLMTAIEHIDQELIERVEWLESHGRLLEAQRLKQRTTFDMEMMRETGTCAGIENYSRHLAGRGEGERPFCLLDFLPEDALIVVDESHVAVPQIGAMYGGDRSRKIPLVEYGFRLPSALDNRPLTFAEWDSMVGQILYVSATPGPYEEQHASKVVEQIIRPTGLVDPQVGVRTSEGQIDDLLREIRLRTEAGERTLITTLTKKMAEDLTDYLREMGVRVRYLHSDIDTLERVEIIRDLRLGVFDVLVGINLLREGLDLPEVSLIAILDADKEGYLRGYRSLIQTIGRAARNINGQVIMYADRESDAMRQALGETDRRRSIQVAHNEAHGITPTTIVKAVHNLETHRDEQIGRAAAFQDAAGLPPDELLRLAKDVEKEMKRAARDLEFERAADLRDRLTALRRHMDGEEPEPVAAGGSRGGRGRPRPRRR
ncbi:MAG TPA: excinuclease ABC subunit UvrB [Candidatus Dormibacteraeota bacterium]|jgi:excinuclease ABC subunit B|nr:excinuclease ABC subunit UvrB [Candidatus Dormibacteraeota bacterium]